MYKRFIDKNKIFLHYCRGKARDRYAMVKSMVYSEPKILSSFKYETIVSWILVPLFLLCLYQAIVWILPLVGIDHKSLDHLLSLL